MAHRPCGLLDQCGARGMLIGDVIGLPIIPWLLAEPVGKAAAKLPKEIPSEVKKLKKALKRKGADAAPAEAHVLSRRVKLKLPTVADIKAAWRALAKAEQPHESPPPPATDDLVAARISALERMFGSQAAMDAIDAARDLETCERIFLEAEWGYEDEYGDPLDKEKLEETR